MMSQETKIKIRAAALIVLLLPLILLWLPIVAVVMCFLYCFLYGVAWFVWMPQGKDVLIVTSDSPVWREYMQREIIAKLEQRSIILNWSERAKWPWLHIPALALQLWGGSNEFNPMVLVFKRFQTVEKFRFWAAFKEYKHGDSAQVERLTKDVFDAVEGK